MPRARTLALASFTLLVGCGSDDTGGSPRGPGDTCAPGWAATTTADSAHAEVDNGAIFFSVIRANIIDSVNVTTTAVNFTGDFDLEIQVADFSPATTSSRLDVIAFMIDALTQDLNSARGSLTSVGVTAAVKADGHPDATETGAGTDLDAATVEIGRTGDQCTVVITSGTTTATASGFCAAATASFGVALAGLSETGEVSTRVTVINYRRAGGDWQSVDLACAKPLSVRKL